MIYLRKYGEAATIDFELFEVDGVDFRVDAVHASGDTVIMKDEGAEANTTNGFTDEGTGYSLLLTATEMQAARIVVYIIDQTATKVWLDRTLIIETYGNASAQHAFDLDTASTAQTGDSFARLGSPAGASVSADIAAIEAQTDDIGVAGAGLTAVPWNSAWDAEVQSEVTDALNAYDPPTHTELINEINDVQTDIAGLNDPTAAAIADAVWDEAKADHTSTTSFGDLATDLDAVLADTNELQSDDVPGLIAALNDPTVAQIADGVWDETLSPDHTSSGSTGEALNAAGAAGDPWTTTLPGSYTGDQAGAMLDRVKTDTSAIVADTNELQGDWADGGRLDLILDARSSQASVDTVDSNVDAILVDTGTTLPAQISGLNDPSVAEIADGVWDEPKADHTSSTTFGDLATDLDTANSALVTIDGIVDAILVDTGTDIPALIAGLNDPTAIQVADELLTRDWNSVSGESARSVLNALRFLRNRWTSSGGTLTVYEEDDATTAWTATLTDDAAADPVTGSDPA